MMSQNDQSAAAVALTTDREGRNLVIDDAVDSPFQVVEVAPLGQADSRRPLTQASSHVWYERQLEDTDVEVELVQMEMEYQDQLPCLGERHHSEEASHGSLNYRAHR